MDFLIGSVYPFFGGVCLLKLEIFTLYSHFLFKESFTSLVLKFNNFTNTLGFLAYLIWLGGGMEIKKNNIASSKIQVLTIQNIQLRNNSDK